MFVLKTEICIPLKKFIAVLAMSCLYVLLASFIELPAGNKTTTGAAAYDHDKTLRENTMADEEAASLYRRLGLQEKGLSAQAFQHAYKGYQVLLEKKLISKEGFLTICDFSRSSKEKRLYLIDLGNDEVLMNTWVAHGRNSGMEFAKKFSNTPESLQSSLGFYVTKQTYHGAHGLSLKLEGIEPGFNDKAFKRAIVIHGADYIGEERLKQSSFMGRSYGCPAVPQKESAALINAIKNGTCLFIYYPDKHYLAGSKILNG